MTTPQTPTDTTEPTEDTTETTEPTEDTTETTEVDTTPEDDQDDDQQSPNAEAAKWRTKLRAAEAERDQLRDQITAQQRALINWRASTAQSGAVDPQLLDAAGITITDLLDDNGHLDMTAVDQFIDQTAIKFRVQRHIKPNPQQGNPSAARATGGMADVFRQ